MAESITEGVMAMSISSTANATYPSDANKKPSSPAALRVFAVPELLEQILLYLSMRGLFAVLRVSRSFRDCIIGSPALQLAMGLAYPITRKPIDHFDTLRAKVEAVGMRDTPNYGGLPLNEEARNQVCPQVLYQPHLLASAVHDSEILDKLQVQLYPFEFIYAVLSKASRSLDIHLCIDLEDLWEDEFSIICLQRKRLYTRDSSWGRIKVASAPVIVRIFGGIKVENESYATTEDVWTVEWKEGEADLGGVVELLREKLKAYMVQYGNLTWYD